MFVTQFWGPSFETSGEFSLPGDKQTVINLDSQCREVSTLHNSHGKAERYCSTSIRWSILDSTAWIAFSAGCAVVYTLGLHLLLFTGGGQQYKGHMWPALTWQHYVCVQMCSNSKNHWNNNKRSTLSLHTNAYRHACMLAYAHTQTHTHNNAHKLWHVVRRPATSWSRVRDSSFYGLSTRGCSKAEPLTSDLGKWDEFN